MDKFLKPLRYIMQIYFYLIKVHFKTLLYVSKHFIIIPTDAHNYKIAGMLKQLKFR